MFRTDTPSVGSLVEMAIKNPRAAFTSVMYSEKKLTF